MHLVCSSGLEIPSSISGQHLDFASLHDKLDRGLPLQH